MLSIKASAAVRIDPTPVPRRWQVKSNLKWFASAMPTLVHSPLYVLHQGCSSRWNGIHGSPFFCEQMLSTLILFIRLFLAQLYLHQTLDPVQKKEFGCRYQMLLTALLYLFSLLLPHTRPPHQCPLYEVESHENLHSLHLPSVISSLYRPLRDHMVLDDWYLVEGCTPIWRIALSQHHHNHTLR